MPPLTFQEFCIKVFCQDFRNRCDRMNLISIVLFLKILICKQDELRTLRL